MKIQRSVLRRLALVLLVGLLSACSLNNVTEVLQPGVDTTAAPDAGGTMEAVTALPTEAAPPGATVVSTAETVPDATATGTAEQSPMATSTAGVGIGLDATATAITVTTVAELARNVDQLIDTTVTVDGEVGTVVNEMALTLAPPGNAGTDSAVLVVSGLQRLEATAGEPARVTGTLRRFDLQAFEQDLGRDLDDATFNVYAGRPAILASTVLTGD